MEDTENLIEEMLQFLDSNSEDEDNNEIEQLQKHCDSSNKLKINSKLNANADIYEAHVSCSCSVCNRITILNENVQNINMSNENLKNIQNVNAENAECKDMGTRPSVRINGIEISEESTWDSVPAPYKPNVQRAGKSSCCTDQTDVQHEDAIWSTNTQSKELEPAVAVSEKKQVTGTENYVKKLRDKCRMSSDPFLSEVNRCIYGESNGHPAEGSDEYFQAAQNYAIYGKTFLDVSSSKSPKGIIENVLNNLAKNLWNYLEEPVLSKLDKELFDSLHGTSAQLKECNNSFNNSSYANLVKNSAAYGLPYKNPTTVNVAHNELYTMYNHNALKYPFTQTSFQTNAATTMYAEQPNVQNMQQIVNFTFGHRPGSAAPPVANKSSPAFYTATHLLYPTTYIRDQSHYINCQYTTTSYFERRQTKTYRQPQNVLQKAFADTPCFPQQTQTIESGGVHYYVNSQCMNMPFTRHAAVQSPKAGYGTVMQQNPYQMTHQRSYLPNNISTRGVVARFISRPQDRRMLRCNIESTFTDRGTQTPD